MENRQELRLKIRLETTIIIHLKGNNRLNQISKCRSDGDRSDPGHILKVATAFFKRLGKIYGGNRGIKDESNILT